MATLRNVEVKPDNSQEVRNCTCGDYVQNYITHLGSW